MLDRPDRMPKSHSRARISHHLTDFFTHFQLIAMHRTFRANRLVHAKLASVKPGKSIIQQSTAIIANIITALLVMPATINTNHHRQGFLLAGKFIIFFSHSVPLIAVERSEIRACPGFTSGASRRGYSISKFSNPDIAETDWVSVILEFDR
jgi:hypothetical protein